MKKLCLAIFSSFFVFSCASSKSKAQQTKANHKVKPTVFKNWRSTSNRLSDPVKKVLDQAFNSSHAVRNAYNFENVGGGMDWWNFPWDLSSSQAEYTITYHDMKELLEAVEVRESKSSSTWISYGDMLNKMVQKLTTTIMNDHGVQRAVKIIYCVRNFLVVSQKHHLTSERAHLKKAAQKLLALNATGKLKNYLYKKNSKFKPPRDIDGKPESRDLTRGISELNKLIAK